MFDHRPSIRDRAAGDPVCQYPGSGVEPRDLSITSLIPDVQLQAVLECSIVQTRERGSELTVFVSLHSVQCAGCWKYVDSLASSPVNPTFGTRGSS